MFIINPTIHNMKMKAVNQMVVISGILVLVATATIAATSYNVQTAKAAANPPPTPYGQSISGYAQNPPNGANNFGSVVSAAAKDPNSFGGIGLGDSRANGCKVGGLSNSGVGTPAVCP